MHKALSALWAVAYTSISGTRVACAVANGSAKILFSYSIANAYEHDSHLLCALNSIMIINRNIENAPAKGILFRAIFFLRNRREIFCCLVPS
jgi:hypothetical protein